MSFLAANEINAGVPQGSLFSLTLFLLDIKDLPKNILRAFLNIYADDTTVYRCPSKNLPDRYNFNLFK